MLTPVTGLLVDSTGAAVLIGAPATIALALLLAPVISAQPEPALLQRLQE
jgi:hypothetical protein